MIEYDATAVALNKYREEAYTEHGGHQPITGDFNPQMQGKEEG